ncbi:uncharacterized protein LOC122662843 [Telopea speciosissima]|uniref:uncharacterized protein LOC122662843 n=1 Tax=Telopea speciosissima TaxID=54955 RepID=UPI001CC666FF|nr:uncharacterized protein LOC122662843 [Telopea speciosissima]
MEMLAIKVGLSKAATLNIMQVQVRSDSLLAVQMILGRYQPPWYIIGLLGEIHALRGQFRSCVFTHHVREMNFCADFLANFVQLAQEIHLCMDSLPRGLSALLRDDANGKKYFRM